MRVPIVQNRNVFTYLRLYERLLVGVVTSFLFRNCLMLFNQKIRLSYFCVTWRNSLHYFYDVSYQCWFASEEAKNYCNNFDSSNAVVCLHLVLAYTVRLAIINAAELERNGCFSLPLLRNVVLWLKRTSTQSFQIELVTKYDTNDANKESSEGESKSAKGGRYPLAD